MYNWTGFYLGIEGGVGGANSQQTDTSGTTSGTYNQLGGLLGGTIGYNWQWSNIVAGVEADLSWADIGGLVSTPLCSAGGGAVCFTDMQWLNTDRVRLGMLVGAQNQFLLYLTGGWAGAGINSGQQSCSTPVAGAIASCGTKTEWRPSAALASRRCSRSIGRPSSNISTPTSAPTRSIPCPFR